MKLDKIFVNVEAAIIDVNAMREMLEVQGRSGNWDYDPYMHGLYNGMEYMLAMVEKREPNFRQAPDKWLKDKG